MSDAGIMVLVGVVMPAILIGCVWIRALTRHECYPGEPCDERQDDNS